MALLAFKAQEWDRGFELIRIERSKPKSKYVFQNDVVSWALWNDVAGISQQAIERGESVQHRGTEGRTALHVAALKGMTAECEVLLRNGLKLTDVCQEGKTPLYMACQEGHLDAAALLVKAGADVNARSQHNESVLHGAAFEGHTQMCLWLMQQGADGFAVDDSSFTVAEYANKTGNEDTADLIRAYAGVQKAREAIDRIEMGLTGFVSHRGRAGLQLG